MDDFVFHYAKRKDNGAYYAEVYQPPAPGQKKGQRRRFTLRTKNKRVAESRFRQLEDAYARGEFDPWTETYVEEGGASVAGAVRRFVASREKHCSKPTVDTYRYVLGLFASRLAPDFPLESVEERHVEKFLKRDIADATKKNYRQRLKIFFTWCQDQKLCKHNPVKLPPRSKKQRQQRLPEFLTEEQFDRLLTTIETDATLKPEIDDNRWLLDAIEFTGYTGLRRAELCNLQWRHVDLKGGFITVANTSTFTTKSGRERRVPLASRALEMLERLASERTSESEKEYVFKGAGRLGKGGVRGTAGQLNGNHLSGRFRHYRRMARLPEEINFHSLRHTFASWAAQRGMNLYALKEILGHSDIKQTQVYASLSPDSLAAAIEVLN